MMKSRIIAIVAVLLVAFAAIMWRSGRPSQRATDFTTQTRQIMSAPVTLVAPEPVADEAARIVFDIFREVDATMSEWKSGSPLTAVNQAAGLEPSDVPAELFEVIARGINIGDQTDGAFDITWAALWGLWDFKAEHPQVPDPADIRERIELIEYREVVLDEVASTVHLPRAGMMIGLGGIAKGTALNRSAEALQAKGIENFIISAGGQVILRGKRGDRPWRIGIRDPRGAIDDYFAHLELSDTSLSTSGDYERYFEINGIRYHHILDPRTGMPSRGLRSATVIAADAEFADALSTALMIIGSPDALELAEQFPEVQVVLVDKDGRVTVSTELEERLIIRHVPAN
jgi:thiamine biosynthesis lipoprotein